MINRENFKFEDVSGPLQITALAETQIHCGELLMQAAEVTGGTVRFRSEGYSDGRPRYGYLISDSDGAVRAQGVIEVLPEMSSDEFARIGEALFGERWKAQMAEELGMTLPSISGFLKGKTMIQSHTKRNILDLVRRRHKALSEILSEFCD